MEPRQGIWRLGRCPGLDGLRGVAVLAVMAIHAGIPHCQWGYLGVDIFFVLSGFLITSVLLEEWNDTGDIRLLNFYARRALRLFPALSIVLLASLLPLSPYPFHDRLRAAAAALFYCANWARAFHWNFTLGALSHTWSLSIEEQFYLIWPFALIRILRGKLRPRSVAVLLVCGLLASAFWRASLWMAQGDADRAFNGLDTHADGLLTGCALSVMLTYGILPRRTALLNAALAVLAVVLVPLSVKILQSQWDDGFMFVAGYAAAVVVSAAMVMTLVLQKSPLAARIFTFPALAWTGRISYGLYLWHVVLFVWIEKLGLRRPFGTPAKLAASFAVASLSFYFIERPCLRLKDRFKTPVPPSPAPRGALTA